MGYLPAVHFPVLMGRGKVHRAGERLRYRREILTHLWERWRNECLRELRLMKRELDTIPKIGDVVLIEDNPRSTPSMWKTGVISQLYPGRDGLARAARVRTTGGGELTRPIQRLHFLESAE